MANEKHLLITFQGNYTAANPSLANETWQFGVRAALVFGVIDDIGTLPDNWNVVASSQHNVEAEWNTDSNWTIDGPGLVSFDPCAYLTDNVMPAAKAFIGSSIFATIVQLQTVRVFPIGSDGKAIPAPPYAVGTPAIGTFTGTPPHGSGSGMVPPQISTVVSLRTSQVGRRGRGRFYPPPLPTGAIGTTSRTGMVSDAARDNMADAAATFLEDVSVAGSGVGEPSVRPIVTGSPWTDYATVVSLIVDNAFDTQRRRRRQIITDAATRTIDYS